MDKRVEIRVTTSDDYYSAFLYITVYHGSFNATDIYQVLKEKNIVYGVKSSTIDRIVKEGVSVTEVLIAEGLPHKFGKDAEIEYKVDSKSVKPKIQDDGRVDFKNIGFVHQVSAGDVLAIKHPATKGSDGITVTGKTIRGKDGKDRAFRFGKNVVSSEDGLVLTAAVDGTYDLDGDKIIVKQLLDIKGDVGLATGNILFTGDVVVHGNVSSGYRIECNGNVTVNGVVEGATIIAGGNVTIGRGIQGMDECVIQCQGNLVSNFISSAKRVSAFGDIETGTILNSKVFSNGKILVKGKKGVIIGGEVSAKILVEANAVGSELGVITSVKLGVDTELHDELIHLTAQVRTLIEEGEKISKVQTLLKKRIEEGDKDTKMLATYSKIMAQSSDNEERLTEKRNKLKLIHELISTMQDAKITSGTIYPGVRIKLGQSNYYVKEPLSDITVMKSKGEIVLRSH